MIKRFTTVPFDNNTIEEKTYTLNDDLRIYVEAFKETNLKTIRRYDGSAKAFIELKYILEHYLSKEKNGEFDNRTLKSLQSIKKLLDDYTEVKWMGAKTLRGGKFFYAFTKFNFPKELKKHIDRKYKDIIKQNATKTNVQLEK